MKILLLTNPLPNQVALANKIFYENKNLSIIVRNNKESKKNIHSRLIEKFHSLFCSLGAVLVFKKMWNDIQKHFQSEFSKFPVDPCLEVLDINDLSVLQIVEDLKPDLVLVSGTNLLKKELIETIKNSGKIMNLHTGISPYVKGGPNCTNWCLSNKEFAYIGNTIMWLDVGVDSGNIIFSEQTLLSGNESFFLLHKKVLEHGHQIYIKVIQEFFKGAYLPSIPQSKIGQGKLYLTRDWTPLKMFTALKNFIFFYKKSVHQNQNSLNPILVKISK